MPLVTLEVPDEGIALVTLNRPERLNTMTADMLQEARDVFTTVAADPFIKVMILTGAGRGFCAGGDLAEGPGGAVTGNLTGEAAADKLREFMETSMILHSMPAVTIAAVNGACAGAGLSWACAADLRFASVKARFNTAFLDAGLSGDFGGTWTLPRIIGAGRAREKYLLSEPFDAAEALRIGLVSEAVSADELMPTVMAKAKRLTQAAPLALQLIKQNLVDGEYSTFSEALHVEAKRHSFCAESKDAAEAATAFMDKRPAVFSGR
ncbi:enoyl-CoA hydratase [Arthrobacter sp. AG258]|uniref:enoyl-CoA hydratase-related protein n=1 Tax=Arthrobacter sp. AG258 TaxID=2183899 RepID=UPI00106135FA|nr:enoyl-CoA hydratase-related protein [Arthrobacter sp. AG258]TDT79518.1 enoyl-CoA hydratase [Arthrobacter sp. AG258]